MFIALVCLLVACNGEDDDGSQFGDPIPNVQAGLAAFYGGDLRGVDAYFCDELVLDARRYANQSAVGGGFIEFTDVQFEVSARQSNRNWTVAMTGDYSIGLSGEVQTYSITADEAVLVGVKVEDETWKICAFEQRGIE